MIIIYKLFNPNSDSFYIGSTSKELKQRLAKHVNKSHECPKRKVYKYILEHGGFKDWAIVELFRFQTDDIIERRMCEQSYIDDLKPDLNSVNVIS
jgi:hypothetical protein